MQTGTVVSQLNLELVMRFNENESEAAKMSFIHKKKEQGTRYIVVAYNKCYVQSESNHAQAISIR
jgi:hypothetical protein